MAVLYGVTQTSAKSPAQLQAALNKEAASQLGRDLVLEVRLAVLSHFRQAG